MELVWDFFCGTVVKGLTPLQMETLLGGRVEWPWNVTLDGFNTVISSFCFPTHLLRTRPKLLGSSRTPY